MVELLRVGRFCPIPYTVVADSEKSKVVLPPVIALGVVCPVCRSNVIPSSIRVKVRRPPCPTVALRLPLITCVAVTTAPLLSPGGEVPSACGNVSEHAPSHIWIRIALSPQGRMVVAASAKEKYHQTAANMFKIRAIFITAVELLGSWYRRF